MKSYSAAEIISRELKAAADWNFAEAKILRDEAADLLREADERTAISTKQLACEEAGTHDFKIVPLSGMFGDRSEEVCRNCGWIHEF